MAVRLTTRNPEFDLATIATMVLALPRPRRVDAIIVFQGLGETHRIEYAVRCRNAYGSRVFGLAGFNTDETTNVTFTREKLVEPPYNLKNRSGIYIARHANHTPDQAHWLCDLIEKCNIASVALHASQYHVVRAHRTVVKEMLRRGMKVPVYPVPTMVPPLALVPEVKMPEGQKSRSDNSGIATAYEMSPGECLRTLTYQKQKADGTEGDVATYEEMADYLDWLWEHPVTWDNVQPR